MMRRTALHGIWWVTALTACTPLGMWVYGDPGFEVSLVRLQAEPAVDSAVVVALTLWNPNDYDISTARFELDLRLDDHSIGRYERDSIIPMTKIDTTTLALAFTPTPGATPARLAAFRSGSTHRFLVEGRATYSTPFGEREVRVAHGGAIAFGGEAAASASDAQDARSGSAGPCPMGHRPCSRSGRGSPTDGR